MKNTILGIIGVLAIGIGMFYILTNRTGDDANVPNTGVDISSWKTSADPARGISFKYPEDLGTNYINTLDWPPQVAVINGPLSCVEGGTEASVLGQTAKNIINNREYCVTKSVEGAAGSTYTKYSYASLKDGGVAILSFSLRSPQCSNFDDSKKGECESEKSTFDISKIIDRIFSTLILGDPSFDYQKG